MSTESLALQRRPIIEERTGLKRSQIDELEKRGQFPKRVEISKRAVGWVKSEVDEWIRARIAARDDQQHDQAAT